MRRRTIPEASLLAALAHPRRDCEARGTVGSCVVVADEHVLQLSPARGRRIVPLRCPPGRRPRRSPSSSGSGEELELDRDGTLVAFGGGSTTDVAGFVAATYKRGRDMDRRADDAHRHGRCGDRREDGDQHRTRERTSPAPSTFRRPSCIDPAILATLPDEERRAGMAEVVKTGLLAGTRGLEAPGGRDDPRLRRVQGGRRPLRPVRARGPPRRS